ncbi:small secreted protein [Hypomontagnella monticulosa]|nr:small secreted protein [Hypomontagnella monticulosa]
MKFTSTAVAAIFATGALAAPTPAPEVKSAMANVPQWTIEGMKRGCDAGNTQCTWSFAINTHLEPATPCTFVVKAAGGKPASHTDSTGNICGKYTVSSGWSDYFGADNGFTTLSVVDYAAKLIVWPAYTDKQLDAGGVVTPDLSYAPSTLNF